MVRLAIGVVLGLAAAFLLPAGRARWPAFAVWVLAWTVLFVRREARAERDAAEPPIQRPPGR